MSWIETIPFAAALGRLRTLYERIRGPDGEVDNILRVHSLRPHTLEGHLALYKSVLHHTANTLPRGLAETIGVYVSLLNGCDYCVEHHAVGVARALGEEHAARIREALERRDLGSAVAERELPLLRYAERLTRDPAGVTEGDVAALRDAGWNDAEILEANQIIAYFAYANRTVLGLGVSLGGDVLGLSPPDDADPASLRHG